MFIIFVVDACSVDVATRTMIDFTVFGFSTVIMKQSHMLVFLRWESLSKYVQMRFQATIASQTAATWKC